MKKGRQGQSERTGDERVVFGEILGWGAILFVVIPGKRAVSARFLESDRFAVDFALVGHDGPSSEKRLPVVPVVATDPSLRAPTPKYRRPSFGSVPFLFARWH
ncbi:MAG: hypothetical protein LBD10_12645 [Desulfobulbus sp.]|uniref:hypothetical protein n=1 Tax=Desulfobulbus sp. TaxID=895 RepID=UPI00283CC3C4|nr:hypothetical protein [Desulfobulbus sp.]MDR2551036.1 hypothetical protein [Desulfobulbus sp.]